MNEASHSVREKNIHLAWFNEGRYFSLAKCWMHHSLSAAIGARAIVGCADLSRGSTSCTAFIANARVAYRTTDARDLSLLAEHSDDMAALFATSDAHLLDPVSGCESLCFDHVAAPLMLFI